MKAAVIRDLAHPPYFGEFPDPSPSADELVVNVTAAPLTQLTRIQASGRHYDHSVTVPFVPGADGVGRTSDGRRVYVAFPRRPFGAMAEQSVVRRAFVTDIPDGIDDATAAAAANPGMASWAGLTLRARMQRGEGVLVNGAGGISGRLALQIARHLGARRIVATARNRGVEGELRQLGADAFVALDQPGPALEEALRQEIANGIDIVLDFLWGPTALSILNAAKAPGDGSAGRRIRYVQIGSVAADSITLPAGALRGSAVELIGSGLGSVANELLVQAIAGVFAAWTSGRFSVPFAIAPLAQVESSWSQPGNERLVFLVS